MTGYTVHTGSNDKFSSGWDRIFQGAEQSKDKPEASASSRRTTPPKSAAPDKVKAVKSKTAKTKATASTPSKPIKGTSRKKS